MVKGPDLDGPFREAGTRSHNPSSYSPKLSLARLFDEEELDAILIPGYLHTPTYECMAASTCVHQAQRSFFTQPSSKKDFREDWALKP